MIFEIIYIKFPLYIYVCPNINLIITPTIYSKNKNNIYLYVKACIINIYKLKSLGEFLFSSFVYCYYY